MERKFRTLTSRESLVYPTVRRTVESSRSVVISICVRIVTNCLISIVTCACTCSTRENGNTGVGRCILCLKLRFITRRHLEINATTFIVNVMVDETEGLKKGQKFPTPTPGFGDRVFYETLLRQRPDSAMAQEW
jgi:hypothetical protein